MKTIVRSPDTLNKSQAIMRGITNNGRAAILFLRQKKNKSKLNNIRDSTFVLYRIAHLTNSPKSISLLTCARHFCLHVKQSDTPEQTLIPETVKCRDTKMCFDFQNNV